MTELINCLQGNFLVHSNELQNDCGAREKSHFAPTKAKKKKSAEFLTVQISPVSHNYMEK